MLASYWTINLPTVLVTSLDLGTVNTKMLLEGWGPCGIPLSQADDTFWQATSQELDLSCSGGYFVSRQNRGKGNYSEKEVKELVAFLEECLLLKK